MSLFESIVKNTFILTAGRVGARILGVIFVAILARAVGPGGVGTYEYAISVITLFLIMPNFGFETLLVRDAAKSDEGRNEFISNILGIKLLLVMAASSLVIIFSAFGGYDNQKLEVFLLVLISGIISSFLSTFCAVFRANEKMEAEAILTILNNVLRVFFGVMAIQIGFKLNGILCGLVVGDSISFLCGLYIIKRYFTNVRLRIGLGLMKSILRSAVPFGVLGLIDVAFFNSATLMIAWLQGEEAVGWYSAATKILLMFLLIPSMFMNAVFPVLSRLYGSSVELVRQTYCKSFCYMLMIALPIGFGGFLISDKIILLIYGGQFQNSILIFKVMVWATLFTFVGFVNGATLNATGQERLFSVLQGFIAVGNIILTYFCIMNFGYIGAAYATVILSGVGFIVYSAMCHKKLGIKPDLSIVGKSLLASIFMGGFIFFLKQISGNLVILIGNGIIIYIVVILLLRAIPKGDLRALIILVWRPSGLQ